MTNKEHACGGTILHVGSDDTAHYYCYRCGAFKVACKCGEWSGEPCAWRGSREDTVIVEFMPADIRSTHDAAGYRGTYPANGARRIRVSKACADIMVDCDFDWVEVK